MRRQAAILTYLELYMISLKNYLFARQLSSPQLLSFTDDHRATPVQDTAQQRHMRRRAVGTCSKDSFNIKTLRKPFLLSLVDTHPPNSQHNWEGCGRLCMWPRQNNARTWTQGACHEGHYLGPVYTIKTEYLRECSASRVWPYIIATRPQTFQSLCFSVIPGSVMLTPHGT